MKKQILFLPIFLTLSGCLTGNMARSLSLKGRPLTQAKQLYGSPDRRQVVNDGYIFTWHLGTSQHHCALSIITDTEEIVKNITMVGNNAVCYHAGSKAPR